MEYYRAMVHNTMDGILAYYRASPGPDTPYFVAFPANLHNADEDLRCLTPANLEFEEHRIRCLLQEPYQYVKPWLPLLAVVLMDCIDVVSKEQDGFEPDKPDWHSQLARLMGPHMKAVPIAAIEFAVHSTRSPFASDVRTMMRMLDAGLGCFDASRGRRRTTGDGAKIKKRVRFSDEDTCNMME